MPDRRSKLLFQHYPRSTSDSVAAIEPEFLGIAACGVVGEYTYSAHRHENYELIVVCKSTYRCLVNNKPLTLSRGGVLIVQPGDWHQDFLKQPVEYFAITMSLKCRIHSESPQFFSDAATPNDQFCRLPAAIELSNKLLRESQRNDALSGSLQQLHIGELFWQLVRAFNPALISPLLVRQSVNQEFRLALERCFRRNLSQSPTLDALASELNMGSRSLTLKCRKLLHTSPAKAFKSYKMDQALIMLQQTAMPIKEISRQLGFQNPFHFSRVFRQVHGKPPSMLRRRFA